MAWTLFGHRSDREEYGLEVYSYGPTPDAPRERIFLCMCCAQPIRGSEFVETRSGLRRHVTCPPASTWGDERLDRLWDEIQQAPRDGAA